MQKIKKGAKTNMKDKRKLKAINIDQVFLYMSEYSPVVSNSCNGCEEDNTPLASCPEVPVEVCGDCSQGAANDIIVDCMLLWASGCY